MDDKKITPTIIDKPRDIPCIEKVMDPPILDKTVPLRFKVDLPEALPVSDRVYFTEQLKKKDEIRELTDTVKQLKDQMSKLMEMMMKQQTPKT